MIWQLVIVVLLVSFNMFVADALVRMRRDVREIHAAVAASSPLLLQQASKDPKELAVAEDPPPPPPPPPREAREREPMVTKDSTEKKEPKVPTKSTKH